MRCVSVQKLKKVSNTLHIMYRAISNVFNTYVVNNELTKTL